MTLFSSLYAAFLDEELGTDDSTTLFTTPRRKAAINKGIQQFAELTECFQRSATCAMVGGTAEYDLNSTTTIAGGDFLRFSKQPVEFHYVDSSSNEIMLAGDDLIRRDIAWLDKYEPGWRMSTVNSSVMQVPQVWYERLEGGKRLIGFWPTPSTGSSAAAFAVIPYVAQPPIVTSDTSEPFQLGANVRVDLRIWHQAAVHYGAHQLEKLRRDDMASDKQLQKFLGYVQRFVANTRTKGGQGLTMARNYFNRRGRPTLSERDPRT